MKVPYYERKQKYKTELQAVGNGSKECQLYISFRSRTEKWGLRLGKNPGTLKFNVKLLLQQVRTLLFQKIVRVLHLVLI